MFWKQVPKQCSVCAHELGTLLVHALSLDSFVRKSLVLRHVLTRSLNGNSSPTTN